MSETQEINDEVTATATLYVVDFIVTGSDLDSQVADPSNIDDLDDDADGDLAAEDFNDSSDVDGEYSETFSVREGNLVNALHIIKAHLNSPARFGGLTVEIVGITKSNEITTL